MQGLARALCRWCETRHLNFFAVLKTGAMVCPLFVLAACDSASPGDPNVIIAITNDLKNSINGSGLALADGTVEQDRAYWEWRVNFSNQQGENPPLMFGVSNKRNAK